WGHYVNRSGPKEVTQFCQNLGFHGVYARCNSGFAVGSLITVDSTLADGFVELTISNRQSLDSGFFVASVNSLIYFAQHSLNFRLDCSIAFTTFLIRDGALLGRF